MQKSALDKIKTFTGAHAIDEIELIQPLWNNYGELVRIYLSDAAMPSVIVKHMRLPDVQTHPRGFSGDYSKRRKVKSYEVETRWYQNQAKQLDAETIVPLCLGVFSEHGETFLVLEDLQCNGLLPIEFDRNRDSMLPILEWLAGFHASFIGNKGSGLWQVGTYWHLETRPEELEKIKGTVLHKFAGLLDAKLRSDPYLTLVHGDAKLANFLSRPDGIGVAAVDFQYVGCGSAMKDVAYFLGSCLTGSELEVMEGHCLDVYFNALRKRLPPGFDGDSVEHAWRGLYPVALADFERFMTGWSPGHQKLTSYSSTTTKSGISLIIGELMNAARDAALSAGKYIQSQGGEVLEVRSKGLEGRAADVVTAVDTRAQEIILEILAPTRDEYDLGVLAEEGQQDNSRHEKHAFWAIDPLDGTRYFVDGEAGYATSIALVNREGRAILGVVYDPVNEELYEVVTGQGVTCNGNRLKPPAPAAKQKPVTRFADKSLADSVDYASLQNEYDIQFKGGAVMNIIHLLKESRAFYQKLPRPVMGGCAIWDVAAVSLMVSETGGHACYSNGQPLHLNRTDSEYFNDTGLFFGSSDCPFDEAF